MEGPVEYALSLKQPWAALVVFGRETIEVRRWPTAEIEQSLGVLTAADWQIVPLNTGQNTHFVFTASASRRRYSAFGTT